MEDELYYKDLIWIVTDFTWFSLMESELIIIETLFFTFSISNNKNIEYHYD